MTQRLLVPACLLSCLLAGIAREPGSGRDNSHRFGSGGSESQRARIRCRRLRCRCSTPKDFVVLEDGIPQEISFFAAADAPFDLVLLLDLSGSNSKNLKMIRNSAKRFVDAARDIDRIALVTFTDQPALYSSFSLDRRKLKKTIDEMDEAIGGTNFWDSMDYVLRDLIPQGAGCAAAQ